MMKLKPKSLTGTRVVVVTVNKLCYVVVFDDVMDALDFDTDMLQMLGVDSVLYFEPVSVEYVHNLVERGTTS